MKNKRLVSNFNLYTRISLIGLLMLGSSPATFGVGNYLLYQHKQKENPDKPLENACSAMDTAGTIAFCQAALSVPVIFSGLALARKKSKERE